MKIRNVGFLPKELKISPHTGRDCAWTACPGRPPPLPTLSASRRWSPVFPRELRPLPPRVLLWGLRIPPARSCSILASPVVGFQGFGVVDVVSSPPGVVVCGRILSRAPIFPSVVAWGVANSFNGMPRWCSLRIDAFPLRRLLLPSPSPLALTRRSSPPLPLRLPFLRCRGSLATVQVCFTCSIATPRSRPSRCFASSSSPTYHYTPSATMQSVRISSSGDTADALVEALLCFGAASCSIEDSNLGAPQEQEIFSDGPVPWQAGKRQLWKEVNNASMDSSIIALFAAGDDVGEAIAMAANSVELKVMPLYEVEELEDCDWVLEIESQFKPIEVSKGLWIVPKWSQPPDAKAVNVIIDPGLAFGTGEHPTTRLCLQWLHRVVNPGDRILDYGTGSGILSIAALNMGAAHAIGVDIDPAAISSAEYNASLNNLKPGTLQVYVASADGEDPVPKDSTGFDIVAANILLNPLLELAGPITGYCKPGGLVGVSGILVEQVALVKEAYSQYLEGMAVSYDNDWACVSGRKKILVQITVDKSLCVEHHS